MQENKNTWNTFKTFIIKQWFWLSNKISLKKVIMVFILTALIITGICLHGKVYICTGNIDTYLADKGYENILSYKVLNYRKFHLVYVNRYKGLKEYEDLFKDSDSDEVKLNAICNYINNFSYNEDQHDPQLMGLYGGNCQAKSLMAKDYFDIGNMENELILSKDLTHMYNKVKISGQWYKLDLTEGKIQKCN